MELLNFAQLGIVVLSLTLAVFHFRLREKHLFHLTFAIFCLSTSLYVTYKLTSGYINPYHHFIGVFSVFTASGYWLFARTFLEKTTQLIATTLFWLAYMQYVWYYSTYHYFRQKCGKSIQAGS